MEPSQKYVYLGGLEKDHPYLIKEKSYRCKEYKRSAFILVNSETKKELVLPVRFFKKFFIEYNENIKRKIDTLIKNEK